MSGAPESGLSSARRFRLRRLLGAGAFGEVYLAEMVSAGDFKRKVAIKLLHADVAQNRGAAMRMRDEARILGHLSHRNIVSVLDLLQLNGRWAIVMAYVPGADLEQVLGRCLEMGRATPPGAVMEIGAAVARALDAAWSSEDTDGRPLQVVHRDIKPSNIRLTPDGEVKVLDFGVARVDMEHREAQTREAGWIGTERYMAPERIMMLGDTPAGDVYALGASLVELLLGVPLGRTPVLPDRHGALVDEALAKVTTRLNGHPSTSEVIDILRSMLHAEPEDRAPASELGPKLDRLARRLGGVSLAEFSAEIVPPLIESAVSEPVDQLLSEDISPSMAGAGRPAPTFEVPRSAPAESTTKAEPRSAAVGFLVGGGLILVVGGVAALALIVIVLGVVGWQLSLAGQTSAEVDTTVVESADPAEPVEVQPAHDQPVLAPEEPEEPQEQPEPPADEPELEPDEGSAEPDTAPVAASPRPTPVAAPPEIPADAPRVRSAKVLFSDASALWVVCGDVKGAGSSSVSLRNAPAGLCQVRATWLGSEVRTSFQLDKPVVVTCRMSGEELTCESP